MSTQIKFRRDTSVNWASINPILGSGEPGLETDTGKVKIGDGSTSWSLLSYVFNGFVASYSNINVAQYLPTYTGNAKASNFNATTAVYSPAYYYSNGVAFVGGGTSGTTYSNSNVAAYLPTYTGNVNASNFVGSTAVYAPAYYWANGAVFASSNYGNTQVAGYLPTYQGALTANNFTGSSVYAGTIGNTGTTLTGTLSTAAQTNITSVGTLSSLIVSGNVGIDGGQITTYDSIIDLHTYSNLAAWASDDGKDLGVRMHYYNAADKLAFMGLENSSKTFQFITDATEVSGNVTGTFGNIQAGSMYLSNAATSTSSTTGALIVGGGVGIAGNVNASGAVTGNSFSSIAVYAGTIGNTGTTLTGTLSTAAQTNITSVGTLTGLTSSGIVNITNSTNTTSAATGALIVTGGVGIGGNLYVTGNITASNINYVNTSTLSATAPIIYLTASTPFPYNYNIGMYSNMYGSASNVLAYTGFVRNHSDNLWYLFSNIGTPTSGAFNFANAALIYDTIKTGGAILANSTASTSTATGALQVAGGAGIVGAVYANSFNGVSVYAGTIGNTGASLVGTISTAAQTSITSLGTLTSLNVSGSVQGNTHVGVAVYANTIGNTGATIVGQIGTNAQPYITSLGTLSSLTVTGAIQGNTHTGIAVYAGTIGNTGATLTGTLSTAAQTNITSLGTLSSLAVTGAVQGNTHTGVAVYAGTIGNTGASLVGTISTAAQTNITSVGTLTSLGVGGTITATTLQAGTIGNTGATITGSSFTGNTFTGVAVYAGTIGNTSATLTGGNIFANAGGVYAGSYYWANGASFSGGSTYSNSNVASYLAANTDATILAINANIVAANSAIVTLNSSINTINSNIAAANANIGSITNTLTTQNSSINALYSNAATQANLITQLTNGAYANANVAAYLPTYTGNLTAGNISAGNIAVGGNITVNAITAGSIGNTGAVINGTINTASQPNITGLGTLSALTVNGTVNATTHVGAFNGAHNGTVGASTPNTGAFTTITTTGDVTVAGNLYINGNSTVINANNITINDTLIYMANANPANSYDIGIVGHFTAGTYQHTGVVRQASSNIWTFFSNVATEPTGNVLTFDSNTVYDTIKVGGIVWGNGNPFSLSSVASATSATYVTGLTAANVQSVIGSVSTSSFPTLNQNTTGSANNASYLGNTIASSYALLAAPTFTTSITTPSIIHSGTSGIGNIGAVGATFNTVFALATSAYYADLAECYAADAKYAPGTVVDFGGDAEITLSPIDASPRVAGVISTNPAHLMNSHLEAEFVAAVALTGRVPTLVQGPVMKGDTMVSAGNGRARAENNPKISTVIGKALENFTGEEGVIEIVVGRL